MFYDAIPQAHSATISSLINHIQRLREKTILLELLSDIRYVYSWLSDAVSNLETNNPADFLYEALNCDIKSISMESPEGGILIDSINNTHGPTHTSYRLNVEEIFSIKKSNEDMQFFPFSTLHNKRFLWFGTNNLSLYKLLGNSLKVPNPEIPSIRYLLGKGI